ncbi:MAG TPA: hypothetical protein ENI23_17790 [bacterium]|nr:hypothetical protein [bacterium]
MNERESIECMNLEMRLLELHYENLNNVVNEKMRPSTIHRPVISRDGNMYCALYGKNPMEGVEGFGESPEKAMQDFDKHWIEKI